MNVFTPNHTQDKTHRVNIAFKIERDSYKKIDVAFSIWTVLNEIALSQSVKQEMFYFWNFPNS